MPTRLQQGSRPGTRRSQARGRSAVGSPPPSNEAPDAPRCCRRSRQRVCGQTCARARARCLRRQRSRRAQPARDPQHHAGSRRSDDLARHERLGARRAGLAKFLRRDRSRQRRHHLWHTVRPAHARPDIRTDASRDRHFDEHSFALRQARVSDRPQAIPGSWRRGVAGLDDGCAESHNRVRPRPARRSSWPKGKGRGPPAAGRSWTQVGSVS